MSNKLLMGIISGAIAGSITGLITSRPVVAIAAGILAGTIIGIFSGRRVSLQRKLLAPKSIPYSPGKNKGNEKLLLKKEELDISKRRVRTGTVSVHKEVSTENKTIVVPVTREELVIEKKVCGTQDPEQPKETTIRIPVKTEKVDIVKHPVILEDVSVYKRKLKKTQRIKETLKTEKLRLETTGDPSVKEIRKYRKAGNKTFN